LPGGTAETTERKKEKEKEKKKQSTRLKINALTKSQTKYSQT